jgi:3-phenylpropionate/trans-cinnamate dioxygenase ferredoxin reductase subunit
MMAPVNATPCFVVLGAGQAGGHAALALRAAGFAGRVALVGDEAYPPYERPPLSKKLLMGEVGLESTFLRPAAHYAEQGIELQLGRRATAIVRADRRIDFAAGEPLHYDRLMLTTGGRPRRLDLPGADLPGIFYLRSIDDVLAMQPAMVPGARVTIVGGGFIGLEVAAAAARRGCRVTVLEVEDWLLKRVAPRIVSDAFEALHRRYGVDIRLATAVIGFSGEGRLRQVATSAGDRLDADLAVIGIGIVPNVELAAAARLEVANGIVVDQFGRTSDPDIYAAGDAVAGHNPLLGRRLRLESWQNAQNQAIAAAKNMAGVETPHGEVPWFWSDQYDLNFQMTGLTHEHDEIVVRGDPSAPQFSVFFLKSGQLAGACCFNNARDIPVARQLIARRIAVSPAQLADLSVPLKQLLRG